MNEYNIYIIDDDNSIVFAIKTLLVKNKIVSSQNIYTFNSGEKFLSNFSPENKSIIILDYQLPGINGFKLIDKIFSIQDDAYIILLTGYGNEKLAVDALKKGIYDYITKPFNNKELLNIITHIIDKILLLKQLESENTGFYFSKEIKTIIEKIKTVAMSDAPVLLIGDTGTGKELIAKLIHRFSKRKGKMISINCSAIPENLFEFELFGAEKGAFTGAYRKKTGFFELANNGTLFFDEIGDIPLPLQAKLLRVLQESSFYRLGGTETININVRIISATNKDLIALMNKNKFRKDFYFRISTFIFNIPPLNKRKDDIIPLAKIFLNEFSKKYSKNIIDFEQDMYNFLLSYSWPGNIRELKNLIEKAVILTKTNKINFNTIKDFLFHSDNYNNNNLNNINNTSDNKNSIFIDISQLPQNFKESKKIINTLFEKKFISYYLKKCEYNCSRTARTIGLYRQDLHKKIKLLNINKNNKGK